MLICFSTVLQSSFLLYVFFFVFLSASLFNLFFFHCSSFPHFMLSYFSLVSAYDHFPSSLPSFVSFFHCSFLFFSSIFLLFHASLFAKFFLQCLVMLFSLFPSFCFSVFYILPPSLSPFSFSVCFWYCSIFLYSFLSYSFASSSSFLQLLFPFLLLLPSVHFSSVVNFFSHFFQSFHLCVHLSQDLRLLDSNFTPHCPLSHSIPSSPSFLISLSPPTHVFLLLYLISHLLLYTCTHHLNYFTISTAVIFPHPHHPNPLIHPPSLYTSSVTFPFIPYFTQPTPPTYFTLYWLKSARPPTICYLLYIGYWRLRGIRTFMWEWDVIKNLLVVGGDAWGYRFNELGRYVICLGMLVG